MCRLFSSEGVMVQGFEAESSGKNASSAPEWMSPRA